mmetsp:Transcript_2980/g.6965  ORF Transcript_2980/g.6965 Transcript_2980/m.6965 type:complete len:403 (-) Transcript_2980:2578-3786(-)
MASCSSFACMDLVWPSWTLRVSSSLRTAPTCSSMCCRSFWFSWFSAMFSWRERSRELCSWIRASESLAIWCLLFSSCCASAFSCSELRCTSCFISSMRLVRAARSSLKRCSLVDAPPCSRRASFSSASFSSASTLRRVWFWIFSATLLRRFSCAVAPSVRAAWSSVWRRCSLFSSSELRCWRAAMVFCAPCTSTASCAHLSWRSCMASEAEPSFASASFRTRSRSSLRLCACCSSMARCRTSFSTALACSLRAISALSFRSPFTSSSSCDSSAFRSVTSFPCTSRSRTSSFLAASPSAATALTLSWSPLSAASCLFRLETWAVRAAFSPRSPCSTPSRSLSSPFSRFCSSWASLASFAASFDFCELSVCVARIFPSRSLTRRCRASRCIEAPCAFPSTSWIF